MHSDLAKGLAWLGVAIASWGAMFSVAKRTLPVLDAFFLGSVRYAFGVLIFIAILWAVEGRQALRYGGRGLPATLFGLFGFCGFNLLVWWGLMRLRNRELPTEKRRQGWWGVNLGLALVAGSLILLNRG